MSAGIETLLQRRLHSSPSVTHSNNGSPTYSVPDFEPGVMRHGFEDDYNSDAYMSLLAQIFYIYYDDKRHTTSSNPRPYVPADPSFPEWRMRDRQKTVSAAIVLCLNIGVDPPDIVKTQPCAKLEAWVDPSTFNDPKKATEQIGKLLQSQYETLSLRTRYKQALDPNVEDAKRFCIGLRRAAKDERILFHYNGHGVPKPTPSGEIWVFNRGYTQYIPVSLYDLQTWLGAPCIFVYDCPEAGHIVRNFKRFVQKRLDDERNRPEDAAPPAIPASAYADCIQLAACQANELLPMNPDLPADLFTCCLTSPIEIAVRWFLLQSPLPTDLPLNASIPGRLADRRTPLGELNWIFTAITDTIAWSLLPRPLFKRLFRQDLMVAALFRNFLLAERIMRTYNCHPISDPPLPDTYNHPMWDAWDLAVDQCLSQLPALQAMENNGPAYEYKHSSFFEEQLTAFEVWLKYGSNTQKPPDQLPVVLQVLLSQVHRLRALILLSKFLDLGPWAVYSALSIGIFPYVLKLLQSPAQELKPVLVFIWARIMSVDYRNIQQELLKDSGYLYFIRILAPQEGLPISNINIAQHRAMCAFVIALFCRDCPATHRVCVAPDVLSACLVHMDEPENPLLRQWVTLCISQLWNGNSEANHMGVRLHAPDKICKLLTDPVPEVRTSAIVALTTFLGTEENFNLEEEMMNREINIAVHVMALCGDGSPLVRREVAVFFSAMVNRYLSKFVVAAHNQLEYEVAFLQDVSVGRQILTQSISYNTPFSGIWKSLLALSVDSFPEVQEYASIVVEYVYSKLLVSPVKDSATQLIFFLLQRVLKTRGDHKNSEPVFRSSGKPETTSEKHHSSYLVSTLKRSISIANSLRSWTVNMSSSPQESGDYKSTLAQVFTQEPNDFGKVPSGPPYESIRKSTKTLPLTSKFIDWASEYFQEPQMSHPDVEEPGSLDYSTKLWRRNRNEHIIAETQAQKELAITGDWQSSVGVLHCHSQPRKIAFGQFEPHLVSTDSNDGVSVWDWRTQTYLNKFRNGNPSSARITVIKFINEDDVPMLTLGSADGVLRIYRHYQYSDKVELACSWRALSEMLPMGQNSGLVADWQQSRGAFLVSGDVKVIRVWDAPREMCIMDILARSNSPVTNITSDQVSGNIFACGFGDGSVRVYDRREDSRNAVKKTWKVHKNWIQGLHMQRGGMRELYSASVDGLVNFWDIRMNQPVVSFKASDRGLRAAYLHEHAPVMATGGDTIKIWSTNGRHISDVRTPTSYVLQNRQQYVSTLCFHPHRMLMAANSAQDGRIHLFSATSNLQHNY
ncbi:hypothetical protein CANCADRAFT_110002 [Tortispora caseinolytica NRRL Y-17796]|uniref:Raptor N-terminal CASPase-like domain-containing protein n=1 Tax=Tortispora caseinolytica NRRL Y-17796 TaxID=767744 RepID=A0A1E4TG19_9ASCO|nr:hypothetical protein CANCADRAFT_110002 [Tortispora caseinolytica NRRL Y-17796]